MNKKIQPAKLKTRKGDLGKSQGKPVKLKTRKGGLGKNKGIKKEREKKDFGCTHEERRSLPKKY